MADGYAGDVMPQQAWDMLANDPQVLLVDVRCEPEWAFVGLPDLSSLGKQVLRASWQLYPTMQINDQFAQQLAAQGATPEHKLLMICRSGARSRSAAIAMTSLGFSECYNVAEGFEGDRDGNLHRGTVGGWKVAGLPWGQG